MSRFNRKPDSPFLGFKSSDEVIRTAVLMYIRYPLSLRAVEDILFARGIDVTYETVRFWWNRFAPCLRAKSVVGGSATCRAFVTLVGTSMRCS